jgi:hypothetical protein
MHGGGGGGDRVVEHGVAEIQATCRRCGAGFRSAIQTVVGIIGPTVQGMIDDDSGGVRERGADH